MNEAYGFAAIIALVTAISILTVATATCINSVREILFKKETKERKLNLSGKTRKSTSYLYTESCYTIARHTIIKMFPFMGKYLTICLFVILFVSLLHAFAFTLSSGGDVFIFDRNSVPENTQIYLLKFIPFITKISISMIFIYVTIVLRYFFRVLIPVMSISDLGS